MIPLDQYAMNEPTDPAEALAAALKANAPARVAQVLERHPELKSRLNDPLPGFAFGTTALLAAIPWGNRETIDLLLQAGADINARSHWWAGGFGVLDDDRGLAPFLIERGARVDAHAAARLGLLERLDELVSADPGLVQARGDDGQTPLHFAPNVEIARYLVERGADIDARDIDHESTPAQWMVRDRPEVARYLVARGARTDILMAAALGDLELVRRHLDTDPACGPDQRLRAVFPQAGPALRRHHLHWTLGSDKTAHVVAGELGHEDVFQLLMERSPEELKLAQACELGDETLFKTLLARRPDLLQTLSEEDRQRLPNAARNNNATAVRLMLAAGWPVNARGQHGGTALPWAAWHGNTEMARRSCGITRRCRWGLMRATTDCHWAGPSTAPGTAGIGKPATRSLTA